MRGKRMPRFITPTDPDEMVVVADAGGMALERARLGGRLGLLSTEKRAHSPEAR